MKIFILSALLILTVSATTSAQRRATVAQANMRYVIRQSGPSECGPAALATLLHYYLGVPTTKTEVMRFTDWRRDQGTTLLGLEKAAIRKGCAANSYRMNYATLKKQLAAYPMPVIVRTRYSQPHFEVLLAIEEDRIYLADPSLGNIVLSKTSFLKRWRVSGSDEGFVFIAAPRGRRVRADRIAQVVRELQSPARKR